MSIRESKRERLSSLLGEIDSSLLEEALRADTPAALAALTHTPARPKSPARVLSMKRVSALVASVAVVLVLAMTLPLILRLGGGIWTDPFDTKDPHESVGDPPYVDPGSVLPPWVSGSLTFTTLTYGDKAASDSAASVYPSLGLLTSTGNGESGGEGSTSEAVTHPTTDSDTDIDTESVTDPDTDTSSATEDESRLTGDTETSPPVYGLGENYTVSLLPNMKITDYLEGGLIKLRPDSGEHTDCPDVYYDIEENAYFCLSCRLGELLTGTELYAKASLACLVEECLLSFAPLVAAENLTPLREEYVAALSATELTEKLARREKITKSALKRVDYYNDEHEGHVSAQLKVFEYPIVDVVEYGADLSRCIVTLISPRTGVGYGNFLCDLTSGTFTSLDKGLSGNAVPTLSLATSVIITAGYRKAVITVPYFGYELRLDRETGLFTPLYARSNIFLYDLERMTCTPLSDGADGYAPLTAGNESMGVITYTGMDGNAYAFHEGVHYTLPAAPLRICRDTDGNRYAVIPSDANAGTGYALYRLNEGIGKPLVLPDTMEGKLDIANRYVRMGSIRVDIVSGETVTLWEGTPAAQVSSRDGRYLYLYFEGETEILCVDVWSGLKGRFAVSEPFLTQAESAGEITYRLLLSHGEDRLLMTYFVESTVAFDAESFLSVPNSERRRMVEYVEDIINHFTVNGQPLRFYEKSRAILLAKLLFLPDYLDMTLTPSEEGGSWKQLCLEVGERMIPYLDVWATSAEVPASVVSEKLGVLTADQFDEVFLFREARLSEHLFSPKPVSDRYTKNREYAIKDCAASMRKQILAFYGVTATEENTAYLDALIIERLDAVVSETSTATRYELQRVAEALLFDAAPTVLGYSYAEFLRSAAFFENSPHWADYRLTTDGTAGDIRCGGKQYVDQDYVSAFLGGITFTEGEVELRIAARVTYPVAARDVILFELGYAPDGRAYVRSHGLYAEITPEAVEAFKTEAVSKQTEYEPVVID